MGLKEKRLKNKAKKSKKSERQPFKGFQTATNYSIIGKSDFLVNLILGHIVHINMEEDWDFEASIFGKYMEISDEAEPIEDEKIIFSKKERNGFTTINIDEDFIDIYYSLLIEDELPEFLDYCKKFLSRKNPELALYYMFAVCEVAIDEDLEFNYKKADYVLDNFKYKGTHTYLDKVKTVITFVKNPSEKHLSDMLLIMNEEEDPYHNIINIIGAISNETLPKYIADKYSSTIEDYNFQKGLLKISIAILQAETIEDFILTLIKGVIYA